MIASHHADIKEFWTVSTKRGPRAYYYSYMAARALPLPNATAELLESTGQAQRIERPKWVGQKRGW